MIYQAYLNRAVVPYSEIQATYPKNVTAEVLEPQARILAQGVQLDPETTALSAQEHEVMEALESGDHDEQHSWLATYQSHRTELLKVIRDGNKD
jgi:hypothetical protein